MAALKRTFGSLSSGSSTTPPAAPAGNWSVCSAGSTSFHVFCTRIYAISSRVCGFRLSPLVSPIVSRDGDHLPSPPMSPPLSQVGECPSLSPVSQVGERPCGYSALPNTTCGCSGLPTQDSLLVTEGSQQSPVVTKVSQLSPLVDTFLCFSCLMALFCVLCF